MAVTSIWLGRGTAVGVTEKRHHLTLSHPDNVMTLLFFVFFFCFFFVLFCFVGGGGGGGGGRVSIICTVYV